MLDFVRLGEFLYEARKNCCYTQSTVAEAVDISEKSLYNIEYGRTEVELSTICKLFDLYDIPIGKLEEFYTRDNEMSSTMEILGMK